MSSRQSSRADLGGIPEGDPIENKVCFLFVCLLCFYCHMPFCFGYCFVLIRRLFLLLRRYFLFLLATCFLNPFSCSLSTCLLFSLFCPWNLFNLICPYILLFNSVYSLLCSYPWFVLLLLFVFFFFLKNSIVYLSETSGRSHWDIFHVRFSTSGRFRLSSTRGYRFFEASGFVSILSYYSRC